ncbi:MAG: RtcB family protein [Chlamydiales bacterium]|nr:RtcB family protein [Chlamydiales bacterium]
MFDELELIAPCTYKVPQRGGMRVPGLIIASEELLKELEMERPLEQVRNVAYLSGVVGYSIAMPDIHWGYGFPIGGVAAMDWEEGVISPGGVGYDINCGVRLALAPYRYRELKEKALDTLLDEIYRQVPSGVGHGHSGRGISDADYKNLLKMGAAWSVEEGFGLPEDLTHCESQGCIKEADPDAVSKMAKERGRKQIGSIGSGNHFVEIGEVKTLLLPDVAAEWGVEEGQLYILIHSGSRGFGHQVCQDALNEFIKKGFAERLPDKQLVAAPIKSSEGKRYFAAMSAAANFAFNNRQQILDQIRMAFKKVLNTQPEQIRLLYDVCHNIAKRERHADQNLCVHRKGATRSFGPGHPELAKIFQRSGQPVLVPGDMGRASFLLVGQGNPITWSSCCHGAGRSRSRIESKKAWKGREPIEYMRAQGVEVRANAFRTIVEEMPDSYKDVNLVVEAVEEAGLARRVARLRPRLVVKG